MNNDYSKEFYVAGVAYHQIKSIINELEKGDYLQLVCESTNQYDPSAVRIERNNVDPEGNVTGVMLGYVPKALSFEITNMILDQSLIPVCQITEFSPSSAPYKMLKVEVQFEDLYKQDETLDHLIERRKDV